MLTLSLESRSFPLISGHLSRGRGRSWGRNGGEESGLGGGFSRGTRGFGGSGYAILGSDGLTVYDRVTVSPLAETGLGVHDTMMELGYGVGQWGGVISEIFRFCVDVPADG